MPYKQGDLVRDFVFPLAIAEFVNDEFKYKHFIGSAFLIGKRGYALTAAHVVKNTNEMIVGMFCGNDNVYYAFPVQKRESHPIQDLALIQIMGENWNSPFVLSKKKEFGWKEYHVCGYPDAILFEDRNQTDIKGNVLPRPDMISAKGHIRRRIQREIDMVKGNMFYELSSVIGWGCSGGPLFNPTPSKSWEVYGIYVAQELYYVDNPHDEKIKYIDYSVAYALTSDSIFDWQPSIIDKTIMEESLDSKI